MGDIFCVIAVYNNVLLLILPYIIYTYMVTDDRQVRRFRAVAIYVLADL
jgi:hypothetical protein